MAKFRNDSVKRYCLRSGYSLPAETATILLNGVPAGYCFDLAGKVKRHVSGSNRPPRFLSFFPRVSFVFVALTVLGVFFGSTTFLWLDPFVQFASLFRRLVVIDSEKCTGCGWCLASCPVVPENSMKKNESLFQNLWVVFHVKTS